MLCRQFTFALMPLVLVVSRKPNRFVLSLRVLCQARAGPTTWSRLPMFFCARACRLSWCIELTSGSWKL